MRKALSPRLVFLLGVLLLPLALTASPTAHAQVGWTINRFDSTLTVLENGDVEVFERIEVDFGSLESRGIFRSVTVEYEYDSNTRRLLEIEDVSVTRGGENEAFRRSRVGADLEIRIGDPDVFLVGPQTYEMRYTASRALNPQAEWDELFWNVTGNKWETTIESASATVIAPAIEQTRCFQGPTRSTAPCEKTEGASPVFRTTEPLRPGSGLTIVVALTKGSVTVQELRLIEDKSDADKVKDFVGLSPLPIAGAVFLGIVGLLGAGRYWWLNGRDKWFGDVHYLTGNKEVTTRPLFAKDTIIVEYMPPEIGRRQRRLRPAEIGTLLDERADTLDVTATMVDLAVRGYMRITEEEKTWIFGSKDYKLEKLKEPDNELLTYEASLLRRLFDEGDMVKMSDLKNEFYKDLAKVKEMLYTQVVSEDKFFPKNPEKVRNFHMAGGIVVLVTGAVIALVLGNAIGAAILGAPVMLVGLAILIFSPQMPHRTPAGREMYRRVLGFREYIEVAEKDRQRFNEEKNIFQEYLPYAIVFGSVDKWAKAFEDMGIEPNTSNWYVGATGFHAVAFSQSLNSFSSSLSSAIASTPGGSGSSGFSSGGGFSGGGVGGGGGGRW